MHSFTAFTAVSLTFKLVAAFIVPRATQPDDWSISLESWNVYHTRYLTLGCSAKHDTTFFDQCCHPLLAGQTAAVLPSQCSPGNEDVDVDGEGDDCEDDGDETTEVPSRTSTLQVPSQTSTKAKALIAVPTTHNTATPTLNAALPLDTVSTTDVDGGFITYYLQKNTAGACGIVHQDTDFIAAMDSGRYNSGLCGQKVMITANQRTVIVTIQDECPTCDNANSIDLSVAAFKNITDLGIGILSAIWSFV